MNRRIPDPVSLIAGIAFTGIGLAFLVGEVELANRARWVWPIALIAVGAGILAAVLGRPSDQAVDATGAASTGAGSAIDVSGPAASSGTPERWHEPGTAPPERSGTAVSPRTEVQPAPEEPSGTEARPAAEGEEPPPAAATAEERPGTVPGSAVDDEAAAAEEPKAAPSSVADEDATEERDRRQADGPPA